MAVKTERERERETNTLPSCLLLIKGVSAQHYILSPTTKTQTSIILHWTALFRGQVNKAKAKCWPQAQSDVEAFITDLLGAGDKTSCRRATATIFPRPCRPHAAIQLQPPRAPCTMNIHYRKVMIMVLSI